MKKKHLRVIREIQDRIPKDLLQRLMKEELAFPAARKTMEEALRRPDSEVSPKRKRRIQAMFDAGILDKKVQVVDHEVENEIDAFITKEIELAVRLGRLPKEAPQLESLANKGIQYARRQRARLEEVFTGTDNDMGGVATRDPQNEEEHSPRQDDGGVLQQGGGA